MISCGCGVILGDYVTLWIFGMFLENAILGSIITDSESSVGLGGLRSSETFLTFCPQIELLTRVLLGGV